MSAASFHTCGIKSDDTLACWGRDWANGPASPPTGKFRDVSTAAAYSCGLRTDGTIACWGNGTPNQMKPPAGKFTGVSIGEDLACGLRADGAVGCGSGSGIPPVQFASIEVGWFQACGLRTNGGMVCWGTQVESRSSRGISKPSGWAAGLNRVSLEHH